MGTVAMLNCTRIIIREISRERCTEKLVEGSFFTDGTDTSAAKITRGKVVIGTGISVNTNANKTQLVLAGKRPLRKGNYVLVISRHRGRRTLVTEEAIEIT